METIDPLALLDDYAGLVSYIAREIHNEWGQRGGRSGDFDERELVQVGWLGLLESMRKFDPERGIKFSTFAVYRIRGAILDYLRAPLIRVPRARQRQQAEMDRVRGQLVHSGQEASRQREVEVLMGREATPRRLMGTVHGPPALENIHLELLTFGQTAQEEREQIASTHPTPEQETFKKERQEQKLQILRTFEECIKGLPFDLMTIFILRDLGELTLQEVGQIMGMKIDAVRRRQIRARKAIRACLEMAGWPVDEVNELIEEDSEQDPGEQ